MNTIQEYFKNNQERLEKEITHEFLNNKDIIHHTNLDYLKEKYRDELMSFIVNESRDIQYYATSLLNQWFLNSIQVIHELQLRRPTITENMNLLKQLKLPEQRSKEWYQIRENLLTASSLADALGKGHFQTRDDLLIDKTRKDVKPFVMHDIMQWGVKYEPVATQYYEYLNSVKIIEFGLIPHPQLSVFGASPDGICDIGSPNGYEGRMLEIKCPPKRKFTHEVPRHYWMQMQGQLEVCDLEECDFFQVKLEEYNDVNEYESDYLFDDGLQHGKTKDGFPKGLVIAYINKNDSKTSIDYVYSPWGASLDYILTWKNSFVDELGDDYKIYDMNWWKITRYESTLVRRDRDWWLSVVPNIIQFWDEVVHYRKVGNEDVQKRIDGRKRKPKFKKVLTIPTLSDEYQLDTDEEN